MLTREKMISAESSRLLRWGGGGVCQGCRNDDLGRLSSREDGVSGMAETMTGNLTAERSRLLAVCAITRHRVPDSPRGV